MSKHPVYGMRGSKPRLAKEPPPEPNGEKSRAEAARERFEINNRLGQTYKKRRNELMTLKRNREAMVLAQERNQLIYKPLVLKQLAYIMVNCRSRFLAIPHHVAARLSRAGAKPQTVQKVVKIVEAQVHAALVELADLPNKSIDPMWVKQLEEEED